MFCRRRRSEVIQLPHWRYLFWLWRCEEWPLSLGCLRGFTCLHWLKHIHLLFDFVLLADYPKAIWLLGCHDNPTRLSRILTVCPDPKSMVTSSMSRYFLRSCSTISTIFLCVCRCPGLLPLLRSVSKNIPTLYSPSDAYGCPLGPSPLVIKIALL